MCNPACLTFGKTHLSCEEITGKKVLDVGSMDINGSLRAYVCGMNPSAYIGVDIFEGPGVDEICDVNNLIDRYGRESFDVIICTELMEHVRDWRKAISNLKNVLKADGVMVLTTRSHGFPHHCFPDDFWRFETRDIHMIFGDTMIEANEKDPEIPGVFVKVRRPTVFVEKDLNDIALYSIIRRKRCRNIHNLNHSFFMTKYALRRLLSRILPEKVKALIKENILNRQDP